VGSGVPLKLVFNDCERPNEKGLKEEWSREFPKTGLAATQQHIAYIRSIGKTLTAAEGVTTFMPLQLAGRKEKKQI
jgi:hypothetical protein